MSIGTHEGDIDEIKFVKIFNQNKNNYLNYINNFPGFSNLWMVRVTTKQLSKLSNQRVFTRADCYLGSFEYDIANLLKENDYYLTEDLLNEKSIRYAKVPFSGISIKMTQSKSFQILKVGPNSFNTLFGNHELGAGASLFCLRENELPKNEDLLKGWNTSIDEMISFFNSKGISIDASFTLNQEICKKIKNFSCKEIENQINNSKSLQEKIFNGKDLYEEPYTAWYFYHGYEIDELTIIPFSVTTGSGRSHGDYTIVLKP